MRYLFGPVASRRFGLSLGIDLSPDRKACNFDCLYCELEPAKPVTSIPNPPSVKEVIEETKEALERFSDIDVITITANGEPTLYPYLDELVDALNRIKKKKKLLILSNASKIDEKEIQNILAKIDIVKLSLDCATKSCFKKLDRPAKSIDLKRIIEGMKEFRKIYHGLLVIEILVVKSLNDKEEEFIALDEVLQQIRPDRVDVGTIDRPPAYKVEPVTYQRLHELASHIHGIPTVIVSRKKSGTYYEELSKEEILDLLAHRPLTQEDIETLFDDQTRARLEELEREGYLKRVKVGEVEFVQKRS